jgi:hypothetical protein
LIDPYAVVLTSNLVEMGGLISLLSEEGSTYVLLCMITGSLLNLRTKQEGGVQHNGTLFDAHIYVIIAYTYTMTNALIL